MTMGRKRSEGEQPGIFYLRNGIALGIICIFAALIIALLVIRVTHVDRVFGTNVGCSGCFNRSVVIHDLPYLSVLLLLLMGGFVLRLSWLRLLLRLAVLAGVGVYALDILVSREMFTRLRFGDVLVFAGQPEILVRHVESTGLIGGGLSGWAVGLAGAVVVFLLWPGLSRIRPRLQAGAAAIPVIGIAVGMSVFPGQYVHDWALVSVVESNFNTGVSRPYSRDTVERALALPERPRCSAGRGERGNLIILILESWSPYQSALFGGINDWTPELDAIARGNAYYTRNHAAGFTTNEGLMGLLAGMELLSPIKPFFSATPFETTWGLERTLPRLLSGRGYRTSFLTTGDLGFTRKGEWLKDIGFDYVEGHDHPAYNGLSRLHFNSAPDAALYARVLSHIEELGERTPFLIVIESVSSHHPYVHPQTHERSAEAVFRYMDRAAADFYRALEARGFFDNGRLYVTSDHRAMVPVSSEERAVLGRNVMSKVPAIWVGRGVPHGEVSVPFHQADLIDTLDRATATTACGVRGIRDMLIPQETEPRCLYHARGDNRDYVDAFCPAGEGTIRLAGDATRIIDANGLAGATGDAAVAELVRYRLRRDLHHDAWLEALKKGG